MDAKTLRSRALALLAQREHSRNELQRKLARIAASDADDDAPAPDLAALLDELAARGYLSEARFVESRLNTRSARFGSQRIRQELAQHGLKLSAEQQEALRATELERAREVWRRKFGEQPPTDATERARQARFLAGRGFAAEIVAKLLRGVTAD